MAKTSIPKHQQLFILTAVCIITSGQKQLLILCSVLQKPLLYLWSKNPWKNLWWCSFSSKRACCRPATLLKFTTFRGNFKEFWSQIQNRCTFYKSYLKNTSFHRTLVDYHFYLSIHLRMFWEFVDLILT